MATLFAPFLDLQPPIAMPTSLTTGRGLAKKRARLRFNSASRAAVQNDNPTTRQNVGRRWPATPLGQIETQTYGFFQATRALSRPHRRVNDTLQPSLFVLV